MLLGEKTKKAIKEFLEQDFDAETELKEQYKCTLGNNMEEVDTEWGEVGIDWDKVNKGDTLYTSSKFDSMKWWRSGGRK